MNRIPCLFFLILMAIPARGQSKIEDLYSDFVLYQNRVGMEKDLKERLIGKTFSMELDSNTSYKYELACGAISQFLFRGKEVAQGFTKLFRYYDQLEYETKTAFLEAVYAVSQKEYADAVQEILDKETDPKNFSICAAYLYRMDRTIGQGNELKIKMVEKFPGYDSLPLLKELEKYLSVPEASHRGKSPDIGSLFSYQKQTRQKTIYSLQRWNRDYPGLAIVQNADGRFARDASGRLLVYQQLARSGTNLPYFLTHGSTPQGIYRILGTHVSHNQFIGPSPNIQLTLPFESPWAEFFGEGWSPAQDSFLLYKNLMPKPWREDPSLEEAWYAGKIGRREIIAHGTTLDPEYFKEEKFYPLTPTEGCLCAKELWNITSGRLLVSEQWGLVKTFLSTPGNKGLLYVLNVDDQQKPVSRAEVEAMVRRWEAGK